MLLKIKINLKIHNENIKIFPLASGLNMALLHYLKISFILFYSK